MFGRVAQTLKDWLGDKTNTWVDPRQSARTPSMPPQSGADDEPKSAESEGREDPSIHDLRQRLMAGQLGEEIQSEHQSQVRIVRAGAQMPSATERRSFTEDGLKTKADQYFVQTIEGRFIRSEEIHKGGTCSICDGLSDQIYFCEVCRRAICLKHAIPWKNVRVCPEHFERLLFQEDTWATLPEGKNDVRPSH
jgi:hypothetical protein